MDGAQKLEQLSAYLEAFAIATKRAKQRYYIDTTAGGWQMHHCEDWSAHARVVLESPNAQPAFTGIHLVERDHASAEHLKQSMAPYPNVHVYEGDCNEVVPTYSRRLVDVDGIRTLSSR